VTDADLTYADTTAAEPRRRALVIEHDHCSPPGAIAERLEQRGYDVEQFLVVPAERFKDPGVEVVLPDLASYDVVVPLGAPWSVDDLDRIGPWITAELAALKAAHDAGAAILGICFGGQALATALGGGVERAPVPEIGWTTIESTEPAIVEAGPWFQFHYDRFVLPPGAVLIASTAVCPQAFRLGRSLGVQFHPEINGDTLQLWYDNDGEAEVRAQGIDSAALLASTYEQDTAGRDRAHRLVDAFLALGAADAARAEPARWE
jgi:GMP synthase-like glutamine amidotransferase